MRRLLLVEENDVESTVRDVRCDRCRHWARDFGNAVDCDDFGQGEVETFANALEQCTTQTERDLHEDGKGMCVQMCKTILPVHYGGGLTVFVTPPEWGCALFEAKTNGSSR